LPLKRMVLMSRCGAILFAWVLWSEVDPTNLPGGGWRIVDASETEEACRAKATRHIEFVRQTLSGPRIDFRSSDNGYGIVLRDEHGKVNSYAFTTLYCLPDTVDPQKKE